MIKGYEDLEIDIWLSQRSFEALLEVRYSSKMQDADDIEKAMRDKFTDGLSTTRQEYLTKLQGAAPLLLESLGKPVLEFGPERGSLAVYRVQLSKADQSVRVGPIPCKMYHCMHLLMNHRCSSRLNCARTEEAFGGLLKMHALCRTCMHACSRCSCSLWTAPVSSTRRSQSGTCSLHFTLMPALSPL